MVSPLDRKHLDEYLKSSGLQVNNTYPNEGFGWVFFIFENTNITTPTPPPFPALPLARFQPILLNSIPTFPDNSK